jgi:RHS repeat-associated protein
MRKTMAFVLVSVFQLFAAFPDICSRCWYEVPDSKLAKVLQTPTPPGSGGTEARMNWNGAAFDSRRSRLIIAGAGAGGDYSGNEVYAFDMDSLKWFRIKDGATTYDDHDTISPYYFNGTAYPDSQQPRPGGTYDQIEYDSTSDKTLIFGIPFAATHTSTWMNIMELDMSTLNWSSRENLTSLIHYGGSVSAQDPTTGKFWIFGNGGSWMSDFDPATGTLTDHGDMWSGTQIATNQTAAIMPSTNSMISIGAGIAYSWDLSTVGNMDHEELETTGCDSLLAVDAPGLEWSPELRKFVGWAGGTHVITMDSTYTCADISPNDSNTVIPNPPKIYGTYGRWRYVPKYNVFVVVNSTDSSVYLYRPSDGTGSEPPGSPLVVIITDPSIDTTVGGDSILVHFTVDAVPDSQAYALDPGVNEIIVSSTNGAGTGKDTVNVTRDITAPVVAITSPTNGKGFTTSPITIHWTIDAVNQIVDTLQSLVEGTNIVTRSDTDAVGNIGSDTITVVLDTQGPVVVITSPATGHLTKLTSIAIAWTIGGTTQTTQLTESLAEGVNTVRRSATDSLGNEGKDSILVTRDTQAPVVVITSPTNGSGFSSTPIPVAWTVDAVAQTTELTAALSLGANLIIRDSTDAAGNTGSDTVVATLYECVVVEDDTLFIETPQSEFCLEIKEDGVVVAHKKLSSHRIVIEDGGVLSTDDSVQVDSIIVESGGLITHSALAEDHWTRHVHILATFIHIEDGGRIDVSEKGFTSGTGPAGETQETIYIGGSHGGSGFTAYPLYPSFPIYGNYFMPVTAGSGGGPASYGPDYAGPGGGIVRLESETLVLDGSIIADGGTRFYGSGAGGSVWLDAEAYSGSGRISASGGEFYAFGGGGRVALYGCDIPQNLRDSIKVTGNENGTIHLACYDDPIVSITSPADSAIIYNDSVRVYWTADGIVQTVDTQEILEEGWNSITRCHTNSHSFTGCDTIDVRVDLHPPVVVIDTPGTGTYYRSYYIGIAWTVDGVPQVSANYANLVEGPNTIIRSYTDSLGSVGADTIVVYADGHPPVIELIHPHQSGVVLDSEMDLRWMVDSVEQEPVHHVMDTSGANRITLTAIDLAGNKDTLLAFFYPGTQVPNLIGLNHLDADTLLFQAYLAGDTTWEDNDTVPTGEVFAKSPVAGDSLRYHWPVHCKISRGLDAVDLIPRALITDSMVVDPLTLVSSGSVQVVAANQGRTATSTPFGVLVFEDRNRDHRYTPVSDLLLGQAMQDSSIDAGDSVFIEVAVAGNLTFNGNRISVMLDYADTVLEVHEDNNEIQSQAMCKKVPTVMDYTPRLLWDWKTTVLGEGGSVFVTPMTANLTDDDGDGKIDGNDVPDVLVSAVGGGNHLMALDGADGHPHWDKDINVWVFSNPAIGDLDGDHIPEIVAVESDFNGWSRRLIILDNQGVRKDSSEWHYWGSIGFDMRENLMLNDLDADGKSEILWGINIHDHHGNLVYPRKFYAELTHAVAADIDGDGYQEVISQVSTDQDLTARLAVISYKEKKTLVRAMSNETYWPMLVVPDTGKVPVILNPYSNLDSIGRVESYTLGTNLGKVYPSGELLNPGYGATMDVFKADLSFYGKGARRLYFSTGSAQAQILGNPSQGVLQPYFARTDLRDSSVTYRFFPPNKDGRGGVFDINEDDNPEILLFASDTLFILDSIGATLGASPVIGQFAFTGVTVADVNKDGHADIMLGGRRDNLSDDATFAVYTNPTWVGARSVYNQYDYTVTNINDDNSIPRFPSPYWKGDNTVRVQCTEGHYACVDASASFPQIAVNDTDGFDITARIGNGGAIELPAGIPIAVYSNIYGSSSLLATSVTTQRLKAGEYYTFKSPIPGGVRGSYEFRIAIDDSGNGHGMLDENNETNNSVTVDFLVDDIKPVVTQPDDQYAEPGVPFSLAIEASDEDGDSLTYSLTHSTFGMTINSSTGLIEWTSGANPPRCTVTVAVTDPYDQSASVTFLVFNGNATNAPPVITSTPTTTVNLNSLSTPIPEGYTYTITASDPESEALEYMGRCVACDNLPGSWPQLIGNEITWFPTQPPWYHNDTAKIEVIVRDARGGLDTQTFVVHMVRTSNSAPAFVSTPDTTATEETAWSSPITVFDLDEDEITLLLDTVPVGMSYSPNSLHWTPAQPGNYVVRIGASDGFDTTWQRFVVVVSPTNDAPRITSLAPLRAISGALYAYPIMAVDEENDVLTYTLVGGPSGMTLSAGGLVEWRSPQSRTASANVEILVEDGNGGETTHTWQILMRPDSIPPTVFLRFSQNPVLPGHAVTVFVDAADNVGLDSVKLTRNGLPVTLISGAYTFTPATAGSYAFAARVVDSLGHSATANGLLKASDFADVSPPTITLSHSPSNPDAGDWVTFSVTVSDTDGVDSSRIWVTVDGLNLPVVAGTATYQALRPGAIPAAAVAYDLLGASALAYDTVSVDPLSGDAVPPTASITSPEDDALLYGRATLIGTAFDAHMAYYTLSHRDITTPVWTEYFRSADNVDADSLGMVDATTLVNGDYEIRLDVYDRSGNSNTASVQIKAVGEKKVGPFTLAFQDLTLPMSGLDVSVTRTYDSRVKTQGDFGIGWQMGLRSIRLSENRNPGTDWTLNRSPGLIPQYSLSGAKPHTVTVTLPGGRTQEFNAMPHFFSAFNPTFGVMQYTAKPGTYSTLKPIDADTFVVSGGEFYDQNGDFQETFNPQVYRLTLLDGSYFTFDQNSGGVIESGDANGNKVAWGGNSISHNAGESIDFGRDELGRITSISDHAGRGMQYQYDVLGNLSAVADANGNVSKFKYGPNSYLTEIFDARGVRAGRTEYDEDGRVVRQINANGDTLALIHDVEANTETIKDYNGNVTTYTYDSAGNVLTKTDDADHTWSYEYDAAGNLLATEQPGGGIKSSTFDAKGNELTSTDELEKTTTRTYDAKGHLLSSLNAVGNLTRYEYDDNGNLEREIGPDDVVQSERLYDAKGNLLKEYNALGDSTRHTYTSQGWLVTTTDPLNRVSRFGYDGAGNTLFEVNPMGDTTRFAYDANGNRTLTVNSAGDTTRTEYNAISKVVKQIDALGHETRFVYNNLGDKIQDIAADSALTDREYDAQGNVKSIIDPVERETRMLYDFENRLIRTTFEDDSYVRTEYDALGRRYRSFDARDNITEYGYDAAGNNITVTDALGRVTEYEYDDAGRKTAMIDALDHRTEYEYDEYDRLVLTTFADATTRGTAYDVLGRKTSETDQAGLITRFYYDAVGNLRAVKSPQGDSTSYTYDVNNNRLTQKDANNHTTSMAYDGLNRMISRTYPNGNQERWNYNSNGAMLSHVKGLDSTAFGYDVRDREVYRKHFNSGHEVVTTYTLDGKRETVMDYRGTTTYSYDYRGRLAGEGHPNGDSLENHYDVQSNRTSVITPFGTTSYTYDELNRMATVVSPQSKTTRYFYDAVGNRDSVSNPNSTYTKYQYDNLNRLTLLKNQGPGGVISSYAYFLNAAGIRIRVTENDSSRVNYTYDSLYRLKSEKRSGTHPDTISYTYDAVGNRLTQVRAGVTTTYLYNNRDQLLSEWNGSDSTLYTYDLAGRMLTKVDALGATSYRWLDEDRLDSLTTPGPDVKYVYDAEGRRVKETVGATVKQYLIDPLLPYGQVILETDGVGDLNSEYVYGLERISQRRSGTSRYFLADGQGSIRHLADSVGAVTDTHFYTAFGEDLYSSGSTLHDFKYVGEQLDPNSGFYYNRARWMDPSTGRLIGVDPEKGDPQAPVSLHRYIYANASPIGFSDPSGRFSISSQMAALVGYSILATAAVIRYSELVQNTSLGVNLTNEFGDIVQGGIDATAMASSVVEIQWDAAIRLYREMAEKAKAEAARRFKNKGTKYELLVRGPSPENGATMNNWNRPIKQGGPRWYMDGGPEGRIKGIGLWAPASGIGSHIEIGQFDNHPIPYDPVWGPDKWKYVYHFHIGPHSTSPHFVVGAVPR